MAAVPQSKSGTTAIKTAPPKETARITVKPSLPGTARVTPAAPTVKPATPAVAGGEPAVKAGTTAMKAAAPKAAGAVPVPAYIPEEEKSTLVSTLAALGLMVVTWGTAAILGYYAYMVQ
jgi:hypothetical protein